MTKLRLKKKIKVRFKSIFIICLSIICFSITFLYVYSIKLYSSNEEFISKLLVDSNHYKKYNNDFINKVTSIIYRSEVSSPISLLTSTFNFDGNYSEDEVYNADELSDISKHISDPNKTDVDKPIVYIYNSHQLENYSNNNYEPYNITPNVMMASYILKEKLIDLGISTIVEENDITEFIRINSWNYNYSYMASRYYIDAAKEQNPTLEYFIDVHRDSITKNYSTATINDKNYAKLLFVVGLEHTNHQMNLDLANYINNKLDTKYPGISKGVLTKEGTNVNGIYNQDASPNAMLIEVGAYENTIDEVYNTMSILSEVLKETIDEKQKNR